MPKKISSEVLNKRVGPKKQTALMMAVTSGNPEMVALLLKHGADRKIEDNKGRSATKLVKKIKDRKARKKILELLSK